MGFHRWFDLSHDKNPIDVNFIHRDHGTIMGLRAGWSWDTQKAASWSGVEYGIYSNPIVIISQLMEA